MKTRQHFLHRPPSNTTLLNDSWLVGSLASRPSRRRWRRLPRGRGKLKSLPTKPSSLLT